MHNTFIFSLKKNNNTILFFEHLDSLTDNEPSTKGRSGGRPVVNRVGVWLVATGGY